MEDITLFGKTYKWNKTDHGSSPYLDLQSMKLDDMKQLLEMIVLDDKGVTCFDHTDYGFVPLEPHCLECGHRLMNELVLYVSEFATHCNNDTDYCDCKGDKEIELATEGEK